MAKAATGHLGGSVFFGGVCSSKKSVGGIDSGKPSDFVYLLDLLLHDFRTWML